MTVSDMVLVQPLVRGSVSLLTSLLGFFPRFVSLLLFFGVFLIEKKKTFKLLAPIIPMPGSFTSFL